jgi:hypothetical protein
MQDFENEEYEIWRYGAVERCSGRASISDLTWEGWCAIRQRMLDAEANDEVSYEWKLAVVDMSGS